MANPQVPQGTLVRVKASVVITNFPELNIIAPNLGRGGISMAPEGPATTFLPTMTGAVQSQEVYQKMTVSAHLLRTQNLAVQYKQKMETDSNLGDIIIRPDTQAGGLTPYSLTNCAIENYREMGFAGADEGYIIIIGGYYQINGNLFD